jgi:hypothetical protein
MIQSMPTTTDPFASQDASDACDLPFKARDAHSGWVQARFVPDSCAVVFHISQSLRAVPPQVMANMAPPTADAKTAGTPR